MTYKVATLKELAATAERLGCTLQVAQQYELLLDIDNATFEEWMLRTEELRKLLVERFGGIDRLEHWASRNGRLHILLELGIAPGREMCIALQAALGSDPKREIIACFEAMNSEEDTRSLFRPKL